MFCPDYNIFRNRFFSLTMYTSYDVPRNYVKLQDWLNPLRYELTISPKGFNVNADMKIINEQGKARITFSNWLSRLKKKYKTYPEDSSL